ncbi:hypothetical protein CEXT_225381 [Caerostris extrusa]|uniref:Uncharacterized protein n=1 Tax=Caerostris extrusa TaxID=172846 RepID=A0AAV4TT25_CAEEX|nr:hypothetical protein CEXT_225381 [Caerostris extrusa]
MIIYTDRVWKSWTSSGGVRYVLEIQNIRSEFIAIRQTLNLTLESMIIYPFLSDLPRILIRARYHCQFGAKRPCGKISFLWLYDMAIKMNIFYLGRAI